MHKKELVGDKIKTGHENTSFLFETPGKEIFAKNILHKIPLAHMEPSSHHSSLQDVIQISHFWLLCSCTVNHLKDQSEISK